MAASDPIITVVAVTGVEIEAHAEAVRRTAELLPIPCKTKVHVVGGMTYADYSRFMVKELYKIIDTQFALTVQADGYAVNADNWTDEFLEYGYVGACWPWHPYVGNGGVSLRSYRFLKESAKLPEPELPEDIWLCCNHRETLELAGVRFAPKELASRFCFELPCKDLPHHHPSNAFALHGPALK